MITIHLPTTLTLQSFSSPCIIELHQFQHQNILTHNDDVTNTLRAMSSFDPHHYPNSFICDFLLIKLNSLLTYCTHTLRPFLYKLSLFYNQLHQKKDLQFCYAHNDAQLISQIILESHTQSYLSSADLQLVLEGSSLVLSTIVFTLKSVKLLLAKSEYSVVLGLTSLQAHTVPFIPIVHHDKNHQGEIDFADRINKLIHVHHEVQRQQKNIIQDAYSMRCTPQVHGVVYDCYSQLLTHFKSTINKPQGKYIYVDGCKKRNLLRQSSTETLMMDSLICSINEIGHMSFLRAERMINVHLRGTKINQNQNYNYLKIMNQKVSYLLNENKLLGCPTNTDTILMNDYQHDIFTYDGLLFPKISKMISNVKTILKMQIMTSIQVLQTIYPNQQPLFANSEMEQVYNHFKSISKDNDIFQTTKLIGEWLEQ